MNTTEKLREIIFGTTTPAGRLFDLFLIISILGSVTAVMLSSIPAVHVKYGYSLYLLEWGFTLLFTVEYAIRLRISENQKKYAFSFFGLVDLIAIIPTYMSLLIPGAEFLTVIRALRVLRVFRVLKLIEYIDGASILADALWNARHKIFVFFSTLSILVVIIGSVMYLVEGENAGFSSIPTSIYWAIVTLTTVGYGDISPQSTLGKALASFVMLTGYAIIAVPTGIITAELARSPRNPKDRLVVCKNCGSQQHPPHAKYCHQCASSLLEI